MLVDATHLDRDPFTALHRADLRCAGLTSRRIAKAVRDGELVRARRGTYLNPGAPPNALAAATIGGLVGCVTALESWQVFVLSRGALHVHVSPHATRLGGVDQPAVLHWRPLLRNVDARSLRVDLIDALIQSTICQPPRAAVASLDSALHLRLIDFDDLDEIFRHVPRRRQVLRTLVDPSAESGSETFVRLLLRSLGLRFQTQVKIEGIGRVDFLVEGWLIIECDSREFHEGWAAQRRDRLRDLAAATRGFSTLRPVAADIFGHLDMVSAAISGVIEHLPPRIRVITPVKRSHRRRSEAPKPPHRDRQESGATGRFLLPNPDAAQCRVSS